MAALTATGRRILVPFGQERYDLAYVDNGRLVRVQVKCGRMRDGALTFVAHSVDRGSARDYRDDADFFAIYCHDRSEIYLVPVDDVPPRGAHLRIVPPKNGQQQKIRWAEPYLLAREPTPQLIEGAVASRVGEPVHRQLSILTDVDIGARMSPMTPKSSTLELTVQQPVACCAPLGAATITTEEADAAATLFKALADPHRVMILNRLLECGEPVCVCELNEELDLAQPTVSFHLKKLVNAGLLAREQRGTWAYFSVVPQAIDQLSQLFKTKEVV